MIELRHHSGPVLLFTGHMIDLPERKTARFPPELERLAAEAIDREVEAATNGAAQTSLAISSAARGGDILFLEACRRRAIECWIVLPLPPDSFVERSVAGPASGNWIDRFWKQWSATAPEQREVLQCKHRLEPYVACNLRLIEIARACDGDVHLITLWNGEKGDGPGGTADFVERAQAAGDNVHWIDSRRLLQSLARGGGAMGEAG